MPAVEWFANRPVVDYDPTYSPVDTTNFVYRLREDINEPYTFEELINAFGDEEDIVEVTALVFGCWNARCWEDVPLDPAVALYRLREKLPRLSALYIGDIHMEEQEISWIQQTEWGKVLSYFPELDTLTLKGGEGLGLTRWSHPCLETLTIEAHRMSNHLIEQVATATFESLERMELWLGSPEYEDLPLTEIRTLFFPDTYLAPSKPRLKHLGLRNCGWCDELLLDTVGSPMWGQLTSLDLSRGTLTDQGLESLMQNPLQRLKRLDVSDAYIEDLALLEQLRSRNIEVIADNLRHDDGHRYVMCWE